MRGSKPLAAAPLVWIASLTSLPVTQSVDLAEDLLVGEGLQLDALAEADRLAGAAALAHAGVHVGDVAADVAVDGADLALLDGAVGAYLGAVHAADAGVFVDDRHRRLALELVGAEQAHHLGAGGARHGDGVGDVARRLAGARHEHAGGVRLDGAQLGVRLVDEAVLVGAHAELLRQLADAVLGSHGRGQHHHVGVDHHLLLAQRVVAPHLDDVAVAEDAADAAADVLGAVLFDGPSAELVVTLAAGTDVHVEGHGAAVVHLVLVEHRVLGAVHAADLAAVRYALLWVAGAHAMDEDHRLGLLAVGRPEDGARGRPGGRRQALELQAVDDVRHLAVAVLAVALEALGLLAPDVVQLEPRGHHDGADLLLDEGVFGVAVDGALKARLLALAAGDLGQALAATLEEGAVLAVEHRDVGHRLRERHVDRRALAEASLELAGDAFRRAGRLAVAAAVAEVLVHRAGFLADLHVEVADVAVDLLDLAPGVERDVGVLVRLHHAWREDALRAVEGGEGLAELAHVAADRGFFLDEDHPVSYTHLRAHETVLDLVCRLLLEKKKK